MASPYDELAAVVAAQAAVSAADATALSAHNTLVVALANLAPLLEDGPLSASVEGTEAVAYLSGGQAVVQTGTRAEAPP